MNIEVGWDGSCWHIEREPPSGGEVGAIPKDYVWLRHQAGLTSVKRPRLLA